MPAKKKISKLKENLSDLVKAHVKRRDNYTCQRCGKHTEGSDCHASHVIPVSRGNALAFEPLNMKILCFHCHINWWHKEPTASGDWFKKKFPERWKYLKEHRNDKVHWKRHHYEEMIEEVKEWS